MADQNKHFGIDETSPACGDGETGQASGDGETSQASGDGETSQASGDGETSQASGGTSQASGGTSQASGGTSQASGGTSQASGGTSQASGGTSHLAHLANINGSGAEFVRGPTDELSDVIITEQDPFIPSVSYHARGEWPLLNIRTQQTGLQETTREADQRLGRNDEPANPDQQRRTAILKWVSRFPICLFLTFVALIIILILYLVFSKKPISGTDNQKPPYHD